MSAEEKLKIIQDTPKKHHFKTKDNQRVNIEHKESQIVLTLYKWDEEAFLEMALSIALSDKIKFLENRIELETSAIKLIVYPIDTRSTGDLYGDTTDVVQCQDGGLRFELILKVKPSVNSFTVPIVTKNLRFSYQPFLTEEQKLSGRIIRPLNVEGSYAVYHTTKRNNQYMTGKAFHIYRPIAEDALGNKAWCSIEIIEGSFTLTIPQAFLDEATYPVTIDPDFGYTSIGGSYCSIADYYDEVVGPRTTRVGSAWAMPAPGGTANYIRAYVSGNVVCDCKVFINQKDSGGAGTHGQIATKENLDCATAAHWEEFTLAGEALTEGVNYILNIIGNPADFAKMEDYLVYYDENGAVASYHEVSQSYAAPESPWTDTPDETTLDYSIYCTYTAAAPPVMNPALKWVPHSAL